MYNLWALKAQGVRKVHPFARVQLFNDFREDTFKTFFFNLRRCCITFIGRISLNRSVKFICFVHFTSDAEVVIYTTNTFVHNWGTNPTMIYPNVSNITRRAYDPITTQHGLVLRCNHKPLRLKRAERKRIGPENHLARTRQDIRDNVAANYACSPVNHALGDTTSPSSNDYDSNDVCIDTSGSKLCVTNVSICDWLFTRLNLFTRNHLFHLCTHPNYDMPNR